MLSSAATQSMPMSGFSINSSQHAAATRARRVIVIGHSPCPSSSQQTARHRTRRTATRTPSRDMADRRPRNPLPGSSPRDPAGTAGQWGTNHGPGGPVRASGRGRASVPGFLGTLYKRLFGPAAGAVVWPVSTVKSRLIALSPDGMISPAWAGGKVRHGRQPLRGLGRDQSFRVRVVASRDLSGRPPMGPCRAAAAPAQWLPSSGPRLGTMYCDGKPVNYSL
jgi:hypothetical protein